MFEDHPITLECFAHGQPKPQVLWYKNGIRISTDSRVYFDSFGYLAISQVKVSDSGQLDLWKNMKWHVFIWGEKILIISEKNTEINIKN